MYFTIAAAIVCGIVILWYLLTFNSLVRAHNAVDQAWSHIEVELKRRLDLIQNLVEIAKGYAKHERETFTQVAALRTQSRPFGDAVAANTAEPDLTRAIGHIMVLAENYPQLRADQSFLNLQKELTETENRIAERRHSYNQTVNMYLNLVRAVPSNVVANIQEMPERAFFDVPDAEVERAPGGEIVMKKLIVPLALLGMALLLGAAVAWDCVRLANDARYRVRLADEEMQKHEVRLTKLLAGDPQTSPEVRTAVTMYQAADGAQVRHDAYDALIATFRNATPSEVDPTNPLDRRFMDDVAGAINRREVAEKQFQIEYDAYRSFLNSRRGGIARMFSSHGRDDLSPSGEK